MTPQYRTILADPPWMERGGGKIKRGADRHYPLMPTKEIKVLGQQVQAIAAPSCHLYLWVTNNFLPDGLEVMAAWGFRYVTKITWVKEGQPGLGQYFRGITEDCLFGVRGNLPYKLDGFGRRAQGTTAFGAPRGRHSEKPERMYELIERVSYGPYLELFARTKRPGWDSWGNEIDSEPMLSAQFEIAGRLVLGGN